MKYSFYGYRLVVFSFLVCFLVSSFFLHARGVFFPQWMTDFDVSRTELSLAVSLTLFAGSCFAPLMGFLIDKFPVRNIIALASLWMAIGYLLLGQVASYWLFVAVLIPFQGLAWLGVGPLVHTKLMVNWFTRNRGMALGIAIMGISVAGVITPLLNAYLAQTIGWRTSYQLYAALLVFLVIPVTFWVVRQKPEDIGQLPDGDTQPLSETAPAGPPMELGVVATYREFLASKAFWSVVLTFGLMNGVYSAMATHLPTYVTSELNLELYDGALLLTVAGGFAIGGKIVFGWMMDQLAAKITVMCGVVAYLASTLLLISVDAYAGLLCAAAMFGLGFGGMIPVRSVLISRLFGVAKFSRVNGLLSFFIAPATFWVLITGAIVDATGTYGTAFKVWFVSFLLAGVVSLLVKLPDRQDAVA
ncbi:MAG: MFS transporter [bacterium]